MKEKFPFRLDFAARASLAEQLATGLTLAIRRGVYRPGERLPTIRGLAEELKVSESVVRAAYRRLADVGAVVGRTRLGSVVSPGNGDVWRGRVLIVMSDFDFNPQMCVHLAKLRARLQSDGFSVIQAMALLDVARKRDFHGIEIAVRQGADFIVLLYGAEDLERHLSGLGIPFCVVGDSSGDYLPKNCVGRIGISFRAAVEALVGRCALRGIRTAEIVGTRSTDGLARSVEEALRTAGVRTACSQATKIYSVDRRFDVAFESGFRMAKRRVADKARLPGLVFVSDDFVATGYLNGLARAGVDVPGDVGFACFSNGGLGPYFTRTVTSLQADNSADGDIIAARVSDYLCRHREIPNEKLSLKFVAGETF